MKRSSKLELTHRINRAYQLLDQQLSRPQIIDRLQTEYGVSSIQAYRYVQQAEKNTCLLPLPSTTKLVTTTLPDGLVYRLKSLSTSMGLPMNQLLRHALEAYLKSVEDGQKEEKTS